jgi:hypothetical protein
MKTPRSFILAALGAAALAGVLGMPRQGNAQAPAAPADEAAAAATVAVEIAKQQVLIVEQQKAIDAKLAIITENLRIAKIYVSRGGGAAAK